MIATIELSNSNPERLRRCVEAGAQAGYQVNAEPLYEILSDAPESIRLEAVELITDVLAADGEASPSELELRDASIERMGLDLNECRALLDKKLVAGELRFAAEGSPLVALGISPKQSPESIQKALNTEFRKWNGRTTHPDEMVRSQAEQMLNLIAEAREQAKV